MLIKSTIVEKMKVMSYVNIVETQVKCAVKEAVKEVTTVKRKCDQKCKDSMSVKVKVQKT